MIRKYKTRTDAINALVARVTLGLSPGNQIIINVSEDEDTVQLHLYDRSTSWDPSVSHEARYKKED